MEVQILEKIHFFLSILYSILCEVTSYHLHIPLPFKE
jgi:hypothetical protein